ncbi:MAG: hypothetical protein K2I90_06050 [Odoribacter sp.]|nr:hypothetical protein [Odoribacter sp.]
MPYSINGISINEQTLSQLFHQIATFGLHYSLGAVLRNGSRKVTTTYADRTSLNTLNRESADKLAMALLKTTQQSTLEKVQQNKEIRVLLPFLARLASLCSETVVINIYKFALKTYLKSLTSEKEDLNIIYSNTLPACIQEIYTEAFSSTLSHKFDIPLPKNGYKYYKPGKTEIDIIANALDAKETKVQEAAYYRAEYLLQAQIDDNSKKTLVLKIRAWRAKATPSILTRHSYTLVAPSKNELNTLESSIKEHIKSFLREDFKCNGGSSSISSLESYLRSLTFLVSFLNDKQISAILKKLADTLDKNYDKFSIDDSKGIWGGLRFFTYSVYKQTSEFVCAILNEGFSNKKPCQELFEVLEKYLPSKLPVRMTMERLNSISHKVDANKMREIITANLFSETKTDVIDSCEALIFHANNGGAVQKILQNLIFYCNHGDTDKMLPYLQTLKQIHYNKMSKSTRNQLAEMMENILKRIPQQNIREEQKVDIMHAGVRLAASLKKETSDKTIAKAIKAWEDYANDKDVYNDVRRPWFIN